MPETDTILYIEVLTVICRMLMIVPCKWANIHNATPSKPASFMSEWERVACLLLIRHANF